MPSKTEEIFLGPSNLETIDYSVYDWLNENLDIRVSTNKNFKKVPIVWVSAERAYQIKNNVDLRDKSGVFTLPVITIERVSVNKSLTSKGSVYGNVYPVNDEKGGSYVIGQQINQYKSSNFINADSAKSSGQLYNRYKNKGVLYKTKKQKPKIVYETLTIPLPIYVNVSYNIGIKTEYQQQMNEIVTPFMSRPAGINYVTLRNGQHVYEGFLPEEFEQSNNAAALGSEERRYETNINLRVLGYILGDGENQLTPKIVKRQNFVQVKFPREHVILGDIPESSGSVPSEPFYRE